MEICLRLCKVQDASLQVACKTLKRDWHGDIFYSLGSSKFSTNGPVFSYDYFLFIDVWVCSWISRLRWKNKWKKKQMKHGRIWWKKGVSFWFHTNFCVLTNFHARTSLTWYVSDLTRHLTTLMNQTGWSLTEGLRCLWFVILKDQMVILFFLGTKSGIMFFVRINLGL